MGGAQGLGKVAIWREIHDPSLCFLKASKHLDPCFCYSFSRGKKGTNVHHSEKSNPQQIPISIMPPLMTQYV